MQPLVRIVCTAGAQVNDTVILLSDVARIHTSDRGLMDSLSRIRLGRSAPPGTSRFINTLDGADVYVKKIMGTREFSIEGASRIAITSQSRSVMVGSATAVIDSFVRSVVTWPGADYRYTIIDTLKKVTVFDKPHVVQVDGILNPRHRGMANLFLTIVQDGYRVQCPFALYLDVTTPVVVAQHSVDRDQPVDPASLSVQRRVITQLRYEPYYAVSDLQNTIASRTISAGTILSPIMIAKTPVVREGETIYVALQRGAVRINVPLRARGSGAEGDRVWAENEISHKMVRVTIQGKGSAVLSAGEAL